MLDMSLGVLVSMLVLLPGVAEGSQRLSQFAHTAWRLQESGLIGQPQALTQTSDGYLWVGTQNGLMRFDGTRFVTNLITPPDPALYLNVISLLGARDGTLWIGTSKGIARLSHGKLFRYTEGTGRINAVVQDRSGTIWYARSRFHGSGPLCKVDGDSVRCLGKEAGIESPFGSTLNLGQHDSLWLGQGDALARWSANGTANYHVPGLAQAPGFEGVGAILDRPDGSLWVGFLRAGSGLGLEQFQDGTWTPISLPRIAGSSLNVTALCQDSHGALWIGTESDGLYRFVKGELDHYSSANGLSNDAVNSILEDKEGDVWVATAEGIDRFHDLPVSRYSVAEGLNGNSVESVLATKDGLTWFGTFGALQSIDKNGVIRSVRVKDGLPGQRVTLLFEDNSGTLWVGTDNRLSRYTNGSFQPIRFSDGRDLGILYGLAQDKEGDLWAISHHDTNSLIRIHAFRAEDVSNQFPEPVSIAEGQDGSIVASFTDGTIGSIAAGRLERRLSLNSLHLTSARLYALISTSDGSLWGVTADGLIGIRDWTPKLFNVQQGLPCPQVFSAVEDRHGNLWLNAACGFVEIPKDQVDGIWKSASAKLHPVLFGVADGAASGPSTFSPNSSSDTSGRLWFANGTTLQSITPDSIPHNPHAPPVHVEVLVADHREYPFDGPLKLPPNTRDVEIDYAALSLRDPQRVQFRYRMAGWDRAWQDAGTRRSAFFSRLRPGTYRFQVIASNNDGVWNTDGDTLQFTVTPAFYQTTWFMAAVLLLAVLLLSLLYKMRMNYAASQMRKALQERTTERTRIARELHDSFFPGIEGTLLHLHSITSRLPLDSSVQTRLSGLFSDSDDVLAQGRELIFELRTSLEDTDLTSAFISFADDAKPLYEGGFEVTASGTERDLNSLARSEILAIAKEALLNAFRHSRGSVIHAQLIYSDKSFGLRITDNGIGISPEVVQNRSRPGHWGLPGMYERASKLAARLTIESVERGGTEVYLQVPASSAYGARTGKSWLHWFGAWRKALGGNG